MAVQIQTRRGTTAEHSSFTGANGEITVDTDKEVVVVHDGATAGGYPLMRENGSNSALALGSAGSPSLKWDANTGIYSPGADQVAISTNGTGRLFVDASGNVGVGASVPGAKFDITESTNVSLEQLMSARGGNGLSSQIRFLTKSTGGGNTGGAIGHSDALGGLILTGSATSIASAQNVVITSAGRVGVGTTSVASTLHTSGSSDQALTIQTTTAGADTRINFRNSTGTDAGGIQYLHNGNHLLFNTNSGEKARIDGSGRLLVGTSTSVSVASLESNQQIFGGAPQLSITRGSNNASGATLALAKSRNTAYGSRTIVTEGDTLGSIRFCGDDGVDLDSIGAQIAAQVDGTPGSDDLPSRLVFSTTADGASSPTERMRIRNAGNILIGATSAESGNSHQVDAVSSSAADFGWFVRHPATDANARGLVVRCPNYNGDDGYLIIGARQGGDRFYVRTSGNVQNTNNSYGAISDIKLKQDIEPAGSQWNDIKSLSVKKFRFKNEPESPLLIGLIAQEAEQVSPGLVEQSEDCDTDGNSLGTVTKSIKYSVLYMKAVKALQEAMERIEILEQRLNDAGIS